MGIISINDYYEREGDLHKLCCPHCSGTTFQVLTLELKNRTMATRLLCMSRRCRKADKETYNVIHGFVTHI